MTPQRSRQRLQHGSTVTAITVANCLGNCGSIQWDYFYEGGLLVPLRMCLIMADISCLQMKM